MPFSVPFHKVFLYVHSSGKGVKCLINLLRLRNETKPHLLRLGEAEVGAWPGVRWEGSSRACLGRR